MAPERRDWFRKIKSAMPSLTTAAFIRQSVTRSHCNQKSELQLTQYEKTTHQIISNKVNNLRKNVAFIERKLRDADVEIALAQNKSNEAINKCLWLENEQQNTLNRIEESFDKLSRFLEERDKIINELIDNNSILKNALLEICKKLDL